MPEYRLATEEEAHERLEAAERLSAKARQANQRSDNYVLTAVLFALVLFFASLAGRTRPGRSRIVLFALTVVALLSAGVLLAVYPVQL